MPNGKNRKLPFILLLGYALALPLIQVHLADVFSGFTGVFLVVAASLLGLKAGLLSAVYATLLIILLSNVTGDSAPTLLAESLGYITIAAGIGYVVEEYRKNKGTLEQDILKRRQIEEQLRHISYHDSLTGLYNRTFFDEHLKNMDTRENLPLTIVMGDVNGLKLVNDTFGHQLGDRLLIRAASILKNHCRQQDLLCRWGGDEFILLMPRTCKQTALQTCEDIVRYCKAQGPDPILLSISFGSATKDRELSDIFNIMKEAEDRMYRNKLLENSNTRFTLVSSLQCLMEEKTEETIGHAMRLQEHVLNIGRKLKLPPEQLDELILLSALHDIGKIAIPDNIIMKLDTLTPEEWEIMKKHSEIGYRIALAAPELSHIAEKILYHHEWWDGSGYPRGLKGEEIPLLSRIVAIADSYDVMTNGRPYKKALNPEEAVGELKRCAGTHFDPHLVEVFLSIHSPHETLSHQMKTPA
jgi:diguanylate cyclase (GGDEF)-like protein